MVGVLRAYLPTVFAHALGLGGKGFEAKELLGGLLQSSEGRLRRGHKYDHPRWACWVPSGTCTACCSSVAVRQKQRKCTSCCVAPRGWLQLHVLPAVPAETLSPQRVTPNSPYCPGCWLSLGSGWCRGQADPGTRVVP